MSEIDPTTDKTNETDLDKLFFEQEKDYLIRKFREREGKFQTGNQIKKIISNPIFHDTLKSLIDHYYVDVFNVCKTIPVLKNSKIFKPNAFWKLNEKRQEHILHPKFRYLSKADAVWFFTPSRQPTATDYQLNIDVPYHIIHEVKTGGYNIDEVFHKYYMGLDSQIWIWGWNKINVDTFPENNTKAFRRYKQGFIKKLDIEFLLPLLQNKFPYFSFDDEQTGGMVCP